MEDVGLKKIEEIYYAALEIQPEKREKFLIEQCGTDENLRREVESLLAYENSNDNFLDDSPEEFIAGMFSEQDKKNDLIGKNVGHYQIKKLLGRGGMGEVYLAEDINLNRQVALKFLPAELTGNKDRLKRFEREAQTASGLNHPNILTIHQFGTENSNLFIVTEFVKGVTLTEKMAGGRLALYEMLNVAAQVAAALAAAHEAGIIHRDIKPDNIMIRADGLVKVLDFGLAKLIETRSAEFEVRNENDKTLIKSENPNSELRTPQLTNPGVIMGTADYMSPEQARGKAVDARTDVFSLGVMLFEMLTGHKPFSGETINHTIVNVLEKETPSVFDLVADCPVELGKIIHKTLAKNPENRFQTAKDLLSNLKKLHKRLEFEEELGRSSQTKLSDEAKTHIFKIGDGEIPNLPPNNLTENSSPIIGREKEIAELTNLLKQENVRLLTMTGIGGTGKTRLAQTIAKRVLEDFPDGVFFVALASITDFKLVVSTIANTLGVKESGGEQILEVLKNYLHDKEILLVVDNFEQVIKAAPDIAELLEAGDKWKILITSRESLHLSAEHEFAVSPLAVPASQTPISFAQLSNYEAVRFFVERAQFAQADFGLTENNADAVAEICRHLDGLPLAIELAAARVKLFSPAAILSRLSDSLKLLTGGAKDLPERRQTMRGAIAWSYDLLNADERKVFERLSVFRGGFTLDGAEAVALNSSVQSPRFSVPAHQRSATGEQPEGWTQNTDSGIDIYDGISSLLDKSLIIRGDQADGEPRFRMLVVVREFAAEKLEKSGESKEIKRRHTDFYRDLSEKAESEIYGAKSEQWCEKLEQEHDNTRAALRWALDNEPKIALQIALSNYLFWLRQGYLAEGCGWMSEALEKGGGDADPKLLINVYRKTADLFYRFGDFESAESYGEEGLRLSRQIADKGSLSNSLCVLAAIKNAMGDFKQARKFAEEGLVFAEELNIPRHIGILLNSLGEIARGEEDFGSARKYYEDALEVSRQESSVNSHYYMGNLACITYLLGDYQASRSYALEVLKLQGEFGDKVLVAQSIGVLTAIAVKAGKPEKAARLSGAEAAIHETTGNKPGKVNQAFIDIYITEIRTAIGDEAFEAEYASGHQLSLKEAIALAREGESDVLSATHITDEANSKNTQILTNDALQAQTAIFAPSNATTPEISRPNNFVSNIRYKQIFAAALLIILLTAGGFIGYRYFSAPDNQIKSIAVMPFVNESRNADVEYLSEGITETLIKRLSNIPGLSVKARSTVFYYKDKKPSPKQLGQELNVDAVLFGHLVQRGDDLKLNLELVDTETQNILWSETYDRKLNDLVFLQGEIALDVSEKLSLKLTTAEQLRVAKNYTTNAEAQRLYLRGRFHWNRRNIKDFEKAVEYFKRAIEKDSTYALAYAGLADTYALMPLYGNFRPNEYKPLAKQSALKALALDANLAEAHASLGYIINTYDFDWDGAERQYKKAIELNPNYATAHQWYAEHLAFRGRTDEALEEISKALELDPFSVVINRMKGNVLGFAKRYDEAIFQLRKAEELYPENALVKFNLGDVYASQKMYPEAVEQYLIALKSDGQKAEDIEKFETAFKNHGWQGFWNEYLNNLLNQQQTVLETDKTAYINSEGIAFAYAATANKEKTLEYLEKAYEERDPDLYSIKMSEVYGFLNDDPRYRELIKKIGLPE